MTVSAAAWAAARALSLLAARSCSKMIEHVVDQPAGFLAVAHLAALAPARGTTLAAPSPSMRETTPESQASSFSAASRR